MGNFFSSIYCLFSSKNATIDSSTSHILTTMSENIWEQIFEYLPPKDIFNLFTLNKKIHTRMNNLWMQKYNKEYFLAPSTAIQKNWYKKFLNDRETIYKSIKLHFIKIKLMTNGDVFAGIIPLCSFKSKNIVLFENYVTLLGVDGYIYVFHIYENYITSIIALDMPEKMTKLFSTEMGCFVIGESKKMYYYIYRDTDFGLNVTIVHLPNTEKLNICDVKHNKVFTRFILDGEDLYCDIKNADMYYLLYSS